MTTARIVCTVAHPKKNILEEKRRKEKLCYVQADHVTRIVTPVLNESFLLATTTTMTIATTIKSIQWKKSNRHEKFILKNYARWFNAIAHDRVQGPIHSHRAAACSLIVSFDSFILQFVKILMNVIVLLSFVGFHLPPVQHHHHESDMQSIIF